MIKANCIEAFKQGARDRMQYPLRTGRYKLEELLSSLRSALDELQRIADLKAGKGNGFLLRSCTPDDIHIWLKRLPSHVAYELGRDLLPGIAALRADGVNTEEIVAKGESIKIRLAVTVQEFDLARQEIGKRISVEYQRMRNRKGELSRLIEDALDLTVEGLSLLKN
jgi:hypothetical protein